MATTEEKVVKLQDEMAQVQKTLEKILKNAEFKDGGEEKRNKGYLPMKNMVPKVLGEKQEEWWIWKEDMEDYMDTTNPGIKKLLKEVAKEDEMNEDKWADWVDKKIGEYPDNAQEYKII